MTNEELAYELALDAIENIEYFDVAEAADERDVEDFDADEVLRYLRIIAGDLDD